MHACRSMPISSRSSTIISAPDLHRTPVPRPLPGNAPARSRTFLHGDRAPAVTEGTTMNRIRVLKMIRVSALTIAVRVLINCKGTDKLQGY